MRWSRGLGLVCRVAAIALLLLRLVAADVPPASGWAIGVIPALATSIAAAFAVVLDPSASIRRLMLIAVIVGHVAWIAHDELGWHTDPFHVRLVMWTIAEGAVVFVFVETRLWRWSLLPGLVLAGWLGYHLLPRIMADVMSERIVWLVQALLLLVANGARRAIQAEDGAAGVQRRQV